MVCDPRRLVRVLLRVAECRVGGTPGLAEQRIAAYIDQRRALDCRVDRPQLPAAPLEPARSEEHTSELQSLMRISYAVFCLKKKTTYTTEKLNICVNHNSRCHH